MLSNGENKFSGEITVSSRIIDDLSSGLYHTPAACLKELINNAFDARATRVDVFVKPDADRIIIEDNGDGMNQEEFERHFRRISESHKRADQDVTKGKPPKGGRPKIGKIGIGFIAANELCETLEIFTTKLGSEELMHVTIDFREMRKPVDQRKKNDDTIVKADYEGEILKTEKESHYMHLFLTEVNERSNFSKQILAGAEPSNRNNSSDTLSLYGLKPESIAELLKDPQLKTWKQFDSYSETMLNVGLNIPVKYHENWIPENYREQVKKFEKEVEDLGFVVFYDGSELRKPIIFSPPNDSMLIDHFDYNGENVSAKGYFYAQHGIVRPNELQGLMVRIRNAAVGEYDHSFWGFAAGDSPLIQKWISAEIWADDRLEDAMNIDRRTLREAHPAYVELRNAIHKHFRHVLNRATNEIFKAASKERKVERESKLVIAIEEFVEEKIEPVSKAAAENVISLVVRAPENKKSWKTLDKKYSVLEVLDLVTDVATEILSPNQLDKFLNRLTERLKDE